MELKLDNESVSIKDGIIKLQIDSINNNVLYIVVKNRSNIKVDRMWLMKFRKKCDKILRCDHFDNNWDIKKGNEGKIKVIN